jgi:hypothetical protein
VGLRQAGNSLLTPRPHFTAPSCTLGNQVVGASDGAPFRQERRPTRVCRTTHAATAQQPDKAITPERRALHRLTIRSQPLHRRASIATTERYTAVDDDEIRAAGLRMVRSGTVTLVSDGWVRDMRTT